ncbi:hypothetical protein [Colwellia sp. Arc7-D]|uniref:hypothetical protein n=1 Tax=Colwellia sp. Arc7-D TaxID=2161872 RepID=UPI000D377067|nr:hypothetical protein [Colwellia sp. Arc7-D]AWB57850.1 hypothetical protein DBO93_09885 [Colwellia sp. Arc7-D]
MKYIFLLIMLFSQLSYASSNLNGKNVICESFDGRAIGLEFLKSDVQLLYAERDDGRIYGLGGRAYYDSFTFFYSTTYDEIKIGIADKNFKELTLFDILKINRHDLAFILKTEATNSYNMKNLEQLMNLIGNKGSCRVVDDLVYELTEHNKEEKKKQRRML